jgi:hypothetical protein
MRALSASERLWIWERGRRQSPVRRSLLLLTAASSEVPPAELARFSVGQRDARLMTLREWMFGTRVEGVTACPECRDELELTFDLSEIRAREAPEAAPSGDTYLLQVGDYAVHFRPPNSTDLQAIDPIQDVDHARNLLLARCIFEIRRGDEDLEKSADRLPPEVAETLVEKMSQIDPQANVRLSLTCPNCEHRWPAFFDIASFLWSEINDWAKRTMREIHLIASAYGWSEADILEMSAERRSFYLEMLGA